MRRLLALHAHPDDESSKGAGTVAMYSDAGVLCTLVTATGGEAGDVLNPALDGAEILPRLADVRREELAHAAKIIGYDEVVMLGYRDSGMPDTDDNRHADAFVNADMEEIEQRLVALVRKHRPQVMLGYDDHERYPHPDHLRIHELSLRVFESAADPERFPDVGPPYEVAKLYAPVFSVKRLLALHRVAEESGIESPFSSWLEDLDPGRDEGKLISSVDCRDTLERARDALRAHSSQVDPDGPWFAMPATLVVDAYPYEDFHLLASHVPVTGPESDLFAGC